MYIRRLMMRKGTFPASSYNDLIDFYRNISKADNAKMVFMNKTYAAGMADKPDRYRAHRMGVLASFRITL